MSVTPSQPSNASASSLDFNRLSKVVESISTKLSNPSLRQISNRAVQAKIWSDPIVSSYMTDLRHEEERIRADIMSKMSVLIHELHQHCIDTTLARANIVRDDRVHAGSSLMMMEDKMNQKENGNVSTQGEEGECVTSNADIICLDAKERLYLILKEYEWIKDFFRLYPMHFFENSFQFINNIPTNKKLNVKVKVVGLGVGGSLAVSGLKKRGIDYVVGYDKRSRYGERSVTSRYQNASWRAYDIAQKLLDEEAYNHLVSYQQQIHVRNDDGSTKVLKSDRVQIILGSAIDSALASAERYGAELKFDCNMDDFYNKDKSSIGNNGNDAKENDDDDNDNEKVDIVALFTGAHTSQIFDRLNEQMNIHKWPELSSKCKMWLQIKPSAKKSAFTTRDIEVGAENWHFAIESARNTIDDVKRIRDSILTQYSNAKKRRQSTNASMDEKKECCKEESSLEQEYQHKLQKIDELIETIEKAMMEDGESRFDYIFANAPDNEHNRSKIENAKINGHVVTDGNYQVDVQIASRSAIDKETSSCNSEQGKDLCNKFSTNVIVMGGDACVPPNPMAAYGATLACEFAEMLVQLAISHGHLNSIETQLKNLVHGMDDEIVVKWLHQLQDLKKDFTKYYDSRGRAENYFQWMQTLICNLYSLPPRD